MHGSVSLCKSIADIKFFKKNVLSMVQRGGFSGSSQSTTLSRAFLQPSQKNPTFDIVVTDDSLRSAAGL